MTTPNQRTTDAVVYHLRAAQRALLGTRLDPTQTRAIEDEIAHLRIYVRASEDKRKFTYDILDLFKEVLKNG